MAILFNSITQFEIQPERTKRRVKRDDLDTLSEIWVGPTGQEDSFVPPIYTRHPDFNLMSVSDTSIKRMPAGVSEVTINYLGKLDGSGSEDYSSLPTISQSWMEGEVSYQTPFTAHFVLLQPPYGTVTQTGIATYSRRYTGRCCQVSYLTNRRPTGNPSNIGLSNDYLGFVNIWEIFSGFQAGVQGGGGGSPIAQIVCSDVRIEDKAMGWYHVTETYQSRQFPGAAAVTPGPITVDTTTPGAAGSVNLAALDSYAGSLAAANAASHAAGQALPMSPGTTFAVSTRQILGLDPIWGTVPNAVAAASTSPSKTTSSVAYTGAVLEF